jgi:hypothetical protein
LPDTDTLDFEPEATETQTPESSATGQVATSRVAKGKTKIAALIDEKLISAADTLDQVSSGFGAVPSGLSAFAKPVQGTLERAGERLRNTDGDELIEQARDLILKRPGAFVIATAVVAAAAAEALVLAARNDAGDPAPQSRPKRKSDKSSRADQPSLA